jgi:2,3-bisphosphoglycerate-independent phosphoglycerate mutase
MRGYIVSSAGVLEGLAGALDIEHRRMPTLPDLAADMRARIEAAAECIAGGATFVIAHTKAPDEAGHRKDPAAKRDAIEALDAGLEGLAGRAGLPDDTIVIVTADHGTPAGTSLIHSGDPVPLAVLSGALRADTVSAFDELACSQGSLGHVRGVDFMPMVLNWRGTVRYTGGRLAPHTGLHWSTGYEPFRVR